MTTKQVLMLSYDHYGGSNNYSTLTGNYETRDWDGTEKKKLGTWLCATGKVKKWGSVCVQLSGIAA